MGCVAPGAPIGRARGSLSNRAQAIATSTESTANAIIQRLSRTRPTLFRGVAFSSLLGFAIASLGRHGIVPCAFRFPL